MASRKEYMDTMGKSFWRAHLLVDVRDVRFGVVERHQPLLASTALHTTHVGERLECTEVERLLLCEDVGVNGLDDLLLDFRDVGARLTMEVLLAGLVRHLREF